VKAVIRPYPPIADYGVAGDGNTAALIARDGSLDWLCWPRFDSPSIFAALLDEHVGGRFRIAPQGPFASAQRYLDDTNVLVTTFDAPGGCLEVTDFVACTCGENGLIEGRSVLYRVARCLAGEVTVETLYWPRPDYGRSRARLQGGPHSLSFAAGSSTVTLESTAPLSVRGGAAEGQLRLREGDVLALALQSGNAEAVSDWERSLRETASSWRRWASRCSYRGPWREAVVRSALALRLLFHAPSGAVVAAPTTSLPEDVGGVRNWDYRYSWLRDAAMTVSALYSLGYRHEADCYADWVLKALDGCHCADGLQVMYGLDGDCVPPERELAHLAGYRASRPVRVGNAAHAQRQLDVYGEVLDFFGLCREFGRARESEAWIPLSRLAQEVVERWREPDRGIWEVRSEAKHFVYSKVMAWVALGRVVQAAHRLHLPGDVRRWSREQERIKSDVLARGTAGSPPYLARAYDDPSPDASNLLVLVKDFLPRDHPLVAGTLEVVMGRLGHGPLVYRYLAEDGLPGHEGAFLPCSFWLVEALAKVGRQEEAVSRFEELVARASALGLLPEEMDPDTGEYLGNYPQGLSHLALVNAAVALEEASGARRERPWRDR